MPLCEAVPVGGAASDRPAAQAGVEPERTVSVRPSAAARTVTPVATSQGIGPDDGAGRSSGT
ncbi:hypothetical protein [Micromonospora tarensis]|uniref:hypothetical protein n=1 Tax=Micromonospora tarensis TaxID=2806100 RepID=UPI001EE414EA|nr:hypothetical protein [Micromonospora tarensis]